MAVGSSHWGAAAGAQASQACCVAGRQHATGAGTAGLPERSRSGESAADDGAASCRQCVHSLTGHYWQPLVQAWLSRS